MTARSPSPGPEPLCWKCGAPNAMGSSECWLCQRPDWNRYPIGYRRPSPPRRRPTIASGMIAIAAFAGTMALFRDSPGVAIFLIILALPAMLLTAAKARQRAAIGDPMPMIERVARCVGLMFLIPIFLIVLFMVGILAVIVFQGLLR